MDEIKKLDRMIAIRKRIIKLLNDFKEDLEGKEKTFDLSDIDIIEGLIEEMEYKKEQAANRKKARIKYKNTKTLYI